MKILKYAYFEAKHECGTFIHVWNISKLKSRKSNAHIVLQYLRQSLKMIPLFCLLIFIFTNVSLVKNKPWLLFFCTWDDCDALANFQIDKKYKKKIMIDE